MIQCCLGRDGKEERIIVGEDRGGEVNMFKIHCRKLIKIIGVHQLIIQYQVANFKII